MGSKKIDTEYKYADYPILDVSKLPDSYRYQYIKNVIKLNCCAIRNYLLCQYKETEREIYVHHRDMLDVILRYMIEDIVKETAVKNPVEFMRYKHVLPDSAFCIIFGLKSFPDIDISNFIDILEEMISCDKQLKNMRIIIKEDFVKLPEFEKSWNEFKSTDELAQQWN